MPRLDTTSRAKSLEPTRSTGPISPHLVKLPNTPAAVLHSNPLELHGSKASLEKEKAKGVKTDTKSTSAPPSPPASRGAVAATTAAATSAAPAADVPDEIDSDSTEEIINMETFEQIIDMDDGDEDHDFSWGIVSDYFVQAADTFNKMDKALEKKDLEALSRLGHFLKGSSAALGVSQVQKSCESMQHYGHLRDEDATGPNKKLTPEEALKKIAVLTKRVRIEYAQAEKWLKNYFKSP